jgi:hypothetical protein
MGPYPQNACRVGGKPAEFKNRERQIGDRVSSYPSIKVKTMALNRIVFAALLIAAVVSTAAAATQQSSRIEVYRLWQAEKTSGVKFGAQKTTLNLVVATPASQQTTLKQHLFVVPIEQLSAASLDDVRIFLPLQIGSICAQMANAVFSYAFLHPWDARQFIFLVFVSSRSLRWRVEFRNLVFRAPIHSSS